MSAVLFIFFFFFSFFFQAEDGIRDAQESRGLGDVYKRQIPSGEAIQRLKVCPEVLEYDIVVSIPVMKMHMHTGVTLAVKNMKGCLWRRSKVCLLYTSDAADDLLCVDLGGRRIIKKKKKIKTEKSAIPIIM